MRTNKKKTTKAVSLGLITFVVLLCSSCIVQIGWTGHPQGQTLLVMGDTITYQGYDELAAELDPNFYHKVVTGNGGYEINQMYEVAGQNNLPAPDVVVINLGTYDALHGRDPSTSAAQWVSLRGMFASTPCIIAVTINEHSTADGYNNATAAAINDFLRPLSGRHIVDWDAMALADPSLVEADGWSPTQSGQEALAYAIWLQAINCELAQPTG